MKDNALQSVLQFHSIAPRHRETYRSLPHFPLGWNTPNVEDAEASIASPPFDVKMSMQTFSFLAVMTL